MGKNELSISG